MVLNVHRNHETELAKHFLGCCRNSLILKNDEINLVSWACSLGNRITAIKKNIYIRDSPIQPRMVYDYVIWNLKPNLPVANMFSQVHALSAWILFLSEGF